MKHFLVLIKLNLVFIVAFSVSCGLNDSDFNTDKSGLRYKFIENSQSQETIFPGDFVEMELKYKNSSDSILFDSKELRAPFRMQIKNVTHGGGSFENALFLMHPGDKMSFVLIADSFFHKTLRQELPQGVENKTDIQFELKLLRKLNPEEIYADREQYLKQMKEQEDFLIKNFKAENNITIEQTISGLYFIKKKEGKGKLAKNGELLTVHYIGKFTDGKVFDSSYQRNEPFEFVLGARQVIDAWEEACSLMKEGDRALLIVPSQLAYGKEGYGGLIPPFTPLIFEIELIAIN